MEQPVHNLTSKTRQHKIEITTTNIHDTTGSFIMKIKRLKVEIYFSKQLSLINNHFYDTLNNGSYRKTAEKFYDDVWKNSYFKSYDIFMRDIR